MIVLLFRLTCIGIPEMRTLVLWRTFNKWSNVAKVCKSRPVSAAYQPLYLPLMLLCQYGDWFLLRQMAKNVEADLYDQFLQALSKDEDFKTEFPERPRCGNRHRVCNEYEYV